MIDLIKDNLEAIRELCRRYGVRTLHLFGSAATGDFDPTRSDVDFIAQWLSAENRASNYLGLAEDLESLLGCRVDLLTVEFVTNPYLREAILEQRIKLYESESRQAAA
jgi:predicted nucleotidyltransferase